MKNFILTWTILCSGICTMSNAAVTVSNVAELQTAVENANAGGDTLILLNDGIYTLNDMLWISANNVEIRSVSRNRDSVIIQGQGGMTGDVSHIFNVPGSNFTAQDMTLRGVANHLIQIHGNNNSDNPTIRNLVLQDAFEQLIKISYENGNPNGSDNGLIENCLFEYTAGIGPQWYIGGIDGHQCTNYTIRNNVFRDIQSPESDLAEHAIHFWSDSIGTRVERNLIINCDRGIGFGLGSRGHQGGVICNNMIYHDSDDFNADVGIGLETATEVHVCHNTIYFESSYQNAIEYRFKETTGNIIENNLCNRNISARNEATSTVRNNILTASADWFANVANGDLHLVSAVSSVVDKGLTVSGLTEDFDGDSRPTGNGYDIGCDEWTGSGSYPVSVDLQLNNSIYQSGELFLLTWSGTSSSGEITGDIYILLDILGMYWFYPSWNTDLDFQTTSLHVGAPTELIVLEFIWPDVDPGNISITFWSCMMAENQYILISNVDQVSAAI